MTGTILGFVKNDYIIQPTDSKPNRNIMVVGGPGSYKTQGFVITNVLNETENSIVVTDPKGEVYEHTAEFKRRQGYDVHVINFSKMEQSDRYNPIDYVTSDLDATNVATKIVDSSNKDGKKDIWYYSQRSLLSALILYVKYELAPENRNMAGLVDFLQSTNEAQSDDKESELDLVFSSLRLDHPAKRLYELGYKKSRGDMKGSIIVSLLTTISNYINQTVSNFTSFSDFNLQEIGRKKTMLYVIIPVMDTSWEGLTNIFFSQIFDQLYELASEQHSKLPVSVDFILDEFVNLGTFTNYEEFLATCRGYGIGVATIIQSLTQLQDKYNKEKAESILGNCSIKICMNAANNTTAKYFSELLDKATVKVATSNKSASKNSKQEGSSTSHSDNEGYSGRDLMTAGEITSMPDDTQIIVFSNLPPIKTKKAFQFDLFPQPKELLNQSDYEKNTNPKQLERLEKLTEEFNQASEKKEKEKQDRIKEKQKQDKIAKEKKEEEEKKNKKEINKKLLKVHSQSMERQKKNRKEKNTWTK
ncbi:type IV secretory system conjugative DNA transfer family protein (plasmid) [Jeotgalibaca sp. MA1X17-3]|uniref:VirD4-like conjugal transfer protein, CD1115 family n=1 Tax=Jeotgalibaca sp. MA1X17-3 TaxID=2908211 RepID=UPI001F2F3F1E|nr:type IV secretory system conjugative DNA transfer family protein [Jeotgalibaca sp. MA1X17-3]UJF16800.1 type IV secretory system conjugative DNA transfer family protein [Jeotgalibaca sp. MA1X17-3]